MKYSIKSAILLVSALAVSTPAVFAVEAVTKTTTETTTTKICTVKCIDPHTNSAESEEVIETLKKIFQAFSQHDIKTVSEYVADDCTGFGDHHKLLVGKQAILDHMQTWLDAKKDNDSPLLSYTIERPYAQVTGDTAIVTFLAYKEFGGVRPRRLVSHSTDIFVKKDGKWMQTHYRNSWKDAAPATASSETPSTAASN